MSDSLFWKIECMLPPNVGFTLFGRAHCICLVLCVITVLLLIRLHRSLSPAMRSRMRRVLASFLLAAELFKDGVILLQGQSLLGYLPLHLCSFSIFNDLLHAFSREQSRLRQFTGELGFLLFAPGAVCALCFPNWTSYPMLNFMNIHSFLWHTLILVYPLLLLREEDPPLPRFRHLGWALLFLIALACPVFLFDRVFDRNYLFLNTPQPGSPLILLEKVFGSSWRLAYAGFVIIVLLLITAFWEYMRCKCMHLQNIRLREPHRDDHSRE